MRIVWAMPVVPHSATQKRSHIACTELPDPCATAATQCSQQQGVGKKGLGTTDVDWYRERAKTYLRKTGMENVNGLRCWSTSNARNKGITQIKWLQIQFKETSKGLFAPVYSMHMKSWTKATLMSHMQPSIVLVLFKIHKKVQTFGEDLPFRIFLGRMWSLGPLFRFATQKSLSKTQTLARSFGRWLCFATGRTEIRRYLDTEKLNTRQIILLSAYTLPTSSLCYIL